MNQILQGLVVGLVIASLMMMMLYQCTSDEAWEAQQEQACIAALDRGESKKNVRACD